MESKKKLIRFSVISAVFIIFELIYYIAIEPRYHYNYHFILPAFIPYIFLLWLVFAVIHVVVGIKGLIKNEHDSLRLVAVSMTAVVLFFFIAAFKPSFKQETSASVSSSNEEVDRDTGFCC